ncbi:MAG TPA: hypothetical protein EYG92_06160 [Lutibacter sp.]|nr:hypothetical protein [Lutibacter sp.]
MKKVTFFIALAFFTFSILQAQESTKFSVGLKAGYNNGFGAQTNFTLYDLVQDIPIHLRLEIGYSNINPGVSADARRIFINNATNGTPEKKGQIIDYRLDFLFPFDLLNDSFIKVGPRYSNYTGNFKYTGGNEDFDVVSNQWGFGLGLGNFFKINEKLNLEINAGFDYFIAATLTGHDTSYSPDNENINARDDNENDNVEFTFKEADTAINQPKYMPHIMVGINYKLF